MMYLKEEFLIKIDEILDDKIMCLVSAASYLDLTSFSTMPIKYIKINENVIDNHNTEPIPIEEFPARELLKYDIIEKDGMLMTSPLRTLLDLMYMGYVDVYAEVMSFVFCQYSKEEIIEYFKSRGQIKLLYEVLDRFKMTFEEVPDSYFRY